MSKVIAFLYKHGKAMTSAVMLVTLGVTMMAGALLTYKTADAATVVSLSDLVSESAPSSASNHTITFTAQTAVAAGGSLSYAFHADFDTSQLDSATDFEVTVNAVDLTEQFGGSCGAGIAKISVASDVVTVGLCTTAVSSGHVVVLKIGKHTAAVGDDQIVNPSTTNASYSVAVSTKTAAGATVDDGTTYVAIVPTVELTAEVAPYFFFRVEGESTVVGSGAYDTFAISSTSQDGWANFGVLTANTPVTMASSLSARTNATNGFVVTLQQNHNMLASSAADIDCFSNGITACDTTYSTWSSPTGTLGDEKTYGHLGIHPTTNNDSGIASTQWFGLENTDLKTIWSQGGAADGLTMDVGKAKVLYRVEVSALQEVGRYENRLMYIGTATF